MTQIYWWEKHHLIFSWIVYQFLLSHKNIVILVISPKLINIRHVMSCKSRTFYSSHIDLIKKWNYKSKMNSISTFLHFSFTKENNMSIFTRCCKIQFISTYDITDYYVIITRRSIYIDMKRWIFQGWTKVVYREIRFYNNIISIVFILSIYLEINSWQLMTIIRYKSWFLHFMFLVEFDLDIRLNFYINISVQQTKY